MSNIDAKQCHGAGGFPGRPAAGTSPWEWYWSMPQRVAIYAWDFGESKMLGTTQWMYSESIVIKLQHDMPEVQRNSVLAHELHHVALSGVCSTMCEKNEGKVRRATAAWLLPDLERLADALQVTTLWRAASRLDVSQTVLLDRLANLPSRDRKALTELMRRPANWVDGAWTAKPVLSAAGCEGNP